MRVCCMILWGRCLLMPVDVRLPQQQLGGVGDGVAPTPAARPPRASPSRRSHFIMGSICKLLEGPRLRELAPEIAAKLGLGLSDNWSQARGVGVGAGGGGDRAQPPAPAAPVRLLGTPSRVVHPPNPAPHTTHTTHPAPPAPRCGLLPPPPRAPS